ncbi:YdcF family protein [Paludisphaera rhizosphaerae]|uniref:YdcF family protein n=1 Tax=Paludisphaera rhizosphaerae TaxID=2711216 RepID=UPI003899508B
MWCRPRPPRRRLAGLTAAVLCLTTVSQPVVAYSLLGSLEWRYPPLEIRPPGAKVVVVLAGSAAAADGWRRTAELGPSTLYRCLHAAEVARKCGNLPILVSGGPIDASPASPTCARLMRDFLVAQGIPCSTLVEEAASRTTYENAAECREKLGLRPPGAVILVTEAIHMERAMRCFQKQGIDAVPAPCHHQAIRFRPSLRALLPSAAAVQSCMDVAHEWIGLGIYWIRGRI